MQLRLDKLKANSYICGEQMDSPSSTENSTADTFGVCFFMLMPMDYTDKYIKILEEENTYLKQRNAELEAQLKDTKQDLLIAIGKWEEAVNKLHMHSTEQYRQS
jgi:hypothetical protein